MLARPTARERQQARDDARLEALAVEISIFAKKQRAKEQACIAPSLERVAKGDLALVPTYNAKGFEDGCRFQTKPPIDSAKKYIEDHEYQVIARFAKNAEFATRHKAIVAAYDGAVAGAFGPRYGGLPDSYRQMASIHEWTMQKLHANWREFAKKLFWAIWREREGQPLAPREIAAHFFPAMTCKDRRDGGFIAMTRTFSWRLMELEQELQNAEKGQVRGGDTLVRVIKAERQGKADDRRQNNVSRAY